MKYDIEVTYRVTVEADDDDHAEAIGWMWTVKHPQPDPSKFMQETVSPDTVDVVAGPE